MLGRGSPVFGNNCAQTTYMYKQKYLIIGAGPVGLAHVKAFKQAGLPFDAVEADSDLGGNWFHGVYETAHIISPKKVMEYSDYPLPEHYPEFPSGQLMLAYYNEYAQRFGLREHIEFHKKVIFARPIENSLWEVRFQDGEIRIYKGVLACNGHHWDIKMPKFEGHFDGEIIHSKDYKHPDQLRGKKVIVIGAGNSACDLASEAARVGKAAYMSIRSSAWFLPKLIAGYPLSHFGKPWVPKIIQKTMLKIGLKIVIGDMERYGLPRPDHEIFEKHPTIGSEALHYIKHGRLTPKKGIKRLAGNKVIFTDDSEVEADLIVAATGFHLSYPFLPPELHRTEGAVAKVYGDFMLDDYKGLYLIGWQQARGGVGALAPTGAEILTHLLPLQDEIGLPLGKVLKEMGYKMPNSHLIGMFEVLENIQKLKKRIPNIRKMGKKLDAALPSPFQNPVLVCAENLSKELQVF